jgi:Lon protease-like protein
MVAECLRTQSGFGVVLIREGGEVGAAGLRHEVGTLARVRDWNMRPDGLLGITAYGEQRLRIVSLEVLDNQLSVARAVLLPRETRQPLPRQYAPLGDLVRTLLSRLDSPYADLPPAYDDAGWVGSRLTELLPVDPLDKQRLLVMEDPLGRLSALAGLLERL